MDLAGDVIDIRRRRAKQEQVSNGIEEPIAERKLLEFGMNILRQGGIDIAKCLFDTVGAEWLSLNE